MIAMLLSTASKVKLKVRMLPVAVCHIVRGLNAKDRVGYLRDSKKRGYCMAKQNLEGVKAR